MSKKKAAKILQIMPAQSGTWALFGDSHEEVTVALPVVCWALTEEEDGSQDVVARVADNYGNATDPHRTSNFCGIAYCRDGEVPPNARAVLLENGQYQVVVDLKAKEERRLKG